MAGELGNVNYDGWKTASPPEGSAPDVGLDPKDLLCEPADVDELMRKLNAIDCTPERRAELTQQLADACVAWMAYAEDKRVQSCNLSDRVAALYLESSRFREAAKKYESDSYQLHEMCMWISRRLSRLGNIRTHQESTWLTWLKARWPFEVCSGEVPRE